MTSAYVPAGASSSTTGKNVVKFIHIWTIEDFNFFLQDRIVQSSTFSAKTNDGIEWYLKMHHNGFNAECENYVSVFLCLLLGSRAAVSADVRILILNADGAAGHESLWYEPKRLKPGFGRGFPKFVKREDLLKDRHRFLRDNKLTLRCEVRYTADGVGTPSSTSELQSEPPERVPLEAPCEFHRSRTLSDVVLTMGGKKYNAHRATLSAHSLFFRAMFEQEYEGEDVPRVEISDMDEDTLIDLLQFIYTGSTENSDNMKNLLASMEKHAKLV